jgi:hypothetical protein
VNSQIHQQITTIHISAMAAQSRSCLIQSGAVHPSIQHPSSVAPLSTPTAQLTTAALPPCSIYPHRRRTDLPSHRRCASLQTAVDLIQPDVSSPQHCSPSIAPSRQNCPGPCLLHPLRRRNSLSLF